MSQSLEHNQKFNALRENYIDKLPRQLEIIENQWAMLNNINWNVEQLEKLQRNVHHIAGTAGNFGFSKLTEEARRLDGILQEFLEKNLVPDPIQKHHTNSAITAMLASIGITQEPLKKKKEKVHLGKNILIVDDDDDQANILKLLCFELGCSAQVINSPQELIRTIKEEAPDVILMDIVFPEGQLAGIDSIRNIYKEIGLKIPVIFISSRNDLSSRVKAYRAGGVGYLQKPIDYTELKIQLELLDTRKDVKANILLIDNDESFLKLTSSVLEKQGFHCFSSTNTAETIHLLEKYTPDILLLDANTSTIKGDEMLNVLRQEIKYAKLPILMLCQDTTPEIVGFATSHGASGIIPKPVDTTILLKSIYSVLRATKSMDAIIERVTKRSSSGLNVHRHYFFSRIERSIRISNQEKSRLLVNLTLKNYEEIRKKIGITSIDELTDNILNALEDEMQPEEYLTRLSELHFSMILNDVSQVSIDSRLDKILGRIANLSCQLNGQTLKLDPCVSALSLTPKIQSVDEAINIVEEKLFSLMSSKSSTIAVEQNEAVKPLSEDELKQTILMAMKKGNLFLNYQPVIDIDGEETLFEGLARLRDGNGAIILPDDFIERIKQMGRHDEFNKLIIKSCIDDIKKLHGQEAEETEIIVKILLGSHSVLSLLTWCSNNLRASGLRGANRLIFSVTQSDAINFNEQLKQLHAGLKDLGCGLMIEQVGSQSISKEQFSELTQELNCCYFKLNPSITSALLNKDQYALELLESLKVKKIPIVTPHVEDHTMFSRLWELGVRHFQGYFVRKPEDSLIFDFNIEETILN